MSSGPSNSDRVFLRRYFEDEARRYDAIYEGHKPLHQKVVDLLFRRVVSKRFSLIVNGLIESQEGLEGKSILDVGCGSGRYALELARQGSVVLGIDISRQMLSLARERARHAGLTKCFFVQGDFLEMDFRTMFDVSLSIGVFDYLRDPLPFLSKLLHLTRAQAVISFPRRLSLRAIPRKVRLFVKGCPIRFYSSREVERLFHDAGGTGRLELRPLIRDFIAFYRTG